MTTATGRSSLLACLLLVLLAGCAQPSQRADAPGIEAPTREAMVAAADPLAVDAGLTILREGGSAVDAAIAVALTLGLVEPESSGVGGGGLLVHYRASDRAIEAFDGREWAPAGARPDMFLQPDGQPMTFEMAQASGLSIGTPSLVAMLAMAHEAHGRLPWARLMQPAIHLAEDGFEIGPRLARSLETFKASIAADPQARSIYLDAQGQPWPEGHRLRNPEYARSLRAIAAEGPRALTQGRIAEEIVAVAQREPRAGTLSLDDLAAFAPRRLEPLCAPFRDYRVCTMPSPSSANAMLSILGLYERARPRSLSGFGGRGENSTARGQFFDDSQANSGLSAKNRRIVDRADGFAARPSKVRQAPRPDGTGNIDDWAAFLWASRLSYVDRDHYMADDRFVEAPTAALIAPDYLDARAALIDLASSPAAIPVGTPAGETLRQRWGSTAMRENGTTHLSIVDSEGNAVALTATIESEYGAQRMAGGFWLNNQLTDFSFEPIIDGKPVANAVAPRKAPRSSMSPSIITDADGTLVLVTGSMGGSTIIASVARSIIGVLDWKLSPQHAVDTPALFARTQQIEVERGRMPAAITEGLRQLGWNVAEADLYSGTHLIQVTPDGLVGGADPRLEGRAVRIMAAQP